MQLQIQYMLWLVMCSSQLMISKIAELCSSLCHHGTDTVANFQSACEEAMPGGGAHERSRSSQVRPWRSFACNRVSVAPAQSPGRCASTRSASSSTCHDHSRYACQSTTLHRRESSCQRAITACMNTCNRKYASRICMLPVEWVYHKPSTQWRGGF